MKEKCQICQKEFLKKDLFPIAFTNHSYYPGMRLINPELDENGFICLKDKHDIKTEFIKQSMQDELGEINELEQEVIESLKSKDILSDNSNEGFEEQLTFGQKFADKISEFGGSWKFITFFLSFMFLWMIYNTTILLSDAYDPYPYILLNLILSCLAAIQAPIIMMSQNRREMKSKIQADIEYKVNLKAELQIRYLHSKIDLLMKYEWYKETEVHRVQMEVFDKLELKIDQLLEK